MAVYEIDIAEKGGDCIKTLATLIMLFGLTFTLTLSIKPQITFAEASFEGEAATGPSEQYIKEQEAKGQCLYFKRNDGLWYRQNTIANGNGQKDAPPNCDPVNGLSGKILQFAVVLSTFVTVTTVGMIIYSGYKYTTSQGDPKAVETAKIQLWRAGVGLFIVLTAFTFMKLFQNASGY